MFWRTLAGVIGTLSLLAPIEADAINQTSERFSNCQAMQSFGFLSARAKDEASRRRYISDKIKNYYEPPTVIVDPRLYASNRHLDKDQNGLICEVFFEKQARISRNLRIFDCVLGGGEWSSSYGVCLKG